MGEYEQLLTNFSEEMEWKAYKRVCLNKMLFHNNLYSW